MLALYPSSCALTMGRHRTMWRRLPVSLLLVLLGSQHARAESHDAESYYEAEAVLRKRSVRHTALRL